jgi:hypothetical protein
MRKLLRRGNPAGVIGHAFERDGWGGLYRHFIISGMMDDTGRIGRQLLGHRDRRLQSLGHFSANCNYLPNREFTTPEHWSVQAWKPPGVSGPSPVRAGWGRAKNSHDLNALVEVASTNCWRVMGAVRSRVPLLHPGFGSSTLPSATSAHGIWEVPGTASRFCTWPKCVHRGRVPFLHTGFGRSRGLPTTSAPRPGAYTEVASTFCTRALGGPGGY